MNRNYTVSLELLHEGVYTITLFSRNNHSWYEGSRITFFGQYDDELITVHKEFSNSVSFTLFRIPSHSYFDNSVVDYVIKQTSDWDVWPAGEQPHRIQIGNVTLTPARTLFFRKSGLSFHNSVAYRFTVLYQYGIIIYLQGKEIIRDNLPSGPINTTTYARGGYSTYTTKSFVRQTPAFKETDSIDLVVELHWIKDDVENNNTIQVLFDMSLNELGNNPDSSCHFLFHNHMGDNVADLDTLSYKEYTDSPATYSRSLSSIAFINSFCFYASNYQWYQPQSFELFLLDSQFSSPIPDDSVRSHLGKQTKVKMVGEQYIKWDMKAWTCFKTVNDNIPASAVEIVMTSNHLPIHLFEVAVGICSHTEYPPLEYDNTKQYFVGVDHIELYPKHNIYSNCYLLSPLPEGLRLTNTTCLIDGIYSGSESDLILSIGATTPIQATTTLHLQIIQCTDLHIQVVREYGETDFFFEWVYFEDIETDETLFSIPTQSSQQSGTQMVYNICLQPRVIRIRLGNDKGITWSTNSYLHINLVTHKTPLPLLTTRYDEGIIGYEEIQLLSLVFPVLPGSLWYYHFDTIPEGWTNKEFIPVGWKAARCGEFPSPTNQLQFYYTSFLLSDVSLYAGFRIHFYAEYCYMVYLNGQLVDAIGMTEKLTPQTYCYGEYSDKFTTLTLPVESFLNSGNNSLVIALIHNERPNNISSFDGYIQFIHSSQHSRLDDITVTTIIPYPDYKELNQSVPDAEVFFDLNSQTSIIINKCEQNRILFSLSGKQSHRMETFNEIVFFNSLKYTDIPDLGGFTLEGRNHKLDNWTFITEVSDLYWTAHGQSKRIFIHPPVSFRYYQLINLTSEMYPKSCSWTLTAITFLLFKPNNTIPIGYPSGQLPAVSLVYLFPFSPYYSNYDVQGLPSLFEIDPIFGMINGVTTEETHLNFQITAQNSKNVMESTSFSLWLHSCVFPDSIPVELHVFPHNPLFPLTASVYHKGVEIVSDTFIIANRDHYKRQYCLSNDESYIFLLQTTGIVSGNNKVWLTIYPFNLPLFPAFLDYRGDYNATVDLSIRIGELSQWKYMVEWESLMWKGDLYNDDDWYETTLTKPFIHDRIIYFRNKLIITDSDVLLHLYLAYEGGVAIFLNGTLVSLLNLPTPYQNTSVATEHHDFNQQEEITINLVQAGVYPGEHTLAIAYHHYPDQTSASSRIVVLAFVVNESTPLYRTSLIYGVKDPQHPQHPPASTFSSLVTTSTEFTTLVAQNDFNSYLQLQPIDMLPLRPRGFRFHITPSVPLQVRLEGSRSGEWDTIVTMITSKEEVEISSEQLLIGYSFFRLKFLSSHPVPVFYISNFAFMFPSEAGPRCDGDQEYLPAWNASISAIPCPDGYTGYQYRECEISTFGPVILDHCLLNEPRDLEYSAVAGEYIVNVDQITLRPIRYSGVVDYFTIEPTLPAGLTFNQTTGVLRGIITKKMPRTDYTITAHNRVGITTVTFALITRNVYCDGNNGWPMRIVQNSSHILSCNGENDRKQIGLRYRRCWIKNGEGVWGEEVKYCFPQSAVALGIVLSVVILSLCYSECSHYCTVSKKRRLNIKK